MNDNNRRGRNAESLRAKAEIPELTGSPGVIWFSLVTFSFRDGASTKGGGLPKVTSLASGEPEVERRQLPRIRAPCVFFPACSHPGLS